MSACVSEQQLEHISMHDCLLTDHLPLYSKLEKMWYLILTHHLQVVGQLFKERVECYIVPFLPKCFLWTSII